MNLKPQQLSSLPGFLSPLSTRILEPCFLLILSVNSEKAKETGQTFEQPYCPVPMAPPSNHNSWNPGVQVGIENPTDLGTSRSVGVLGVWPSCVVVPLIRWPLPVLTELLSIFRVLTDPTLLNLCNGTYVTLSIVLVEAG